MTDDAPLEPVAPEPATEPVTEPVDTVPTEAAPTQPVPAAGEPGGPPPWPTPSPGAPPSGPPPGTQPPGTQPPGDPGAARPPGSSTVAVPKWLLLVVGVIVIAAIGFGVGYAVAPDDGGSDNASIPNRGFDNGPFGNGPFNDGTRPGDGSTAPAPEPRLLTGAFLGVATAASTDPAGARILRVVEGSPAEDADLEVDDVITKVDGDAVDGPEQLATHIRAQDPGDQVTITYERDGDADTARVTLSERSSIELPTPSTSQPRL